MVVDEAGHQVRARVNAHHVLDPPAEFGGRPAARENIAERTVEREIEHPGHQGLAARVRHIALDLRRTGVRKRLVDGEALAEDMEGPAAGLPRYLHHPRRGLVAAVEKVVEQLGRDIEGRIDAKRIDADLANPVAVAVTQGAAHARVLGIQIVQARHLEIELLCRIGIVGDRRCPVVDGGAPVRGDARVVQIEGRLRGRSGRLGACIGHIKARRVGGVPATAVVEEIAGVVEHDVLDEVHALAVQGARQALVVGEPAQVFVDALEMLGPVAVVAAAGATWVEPLVGHRRRDPQRSGAQAADVVQARRQARQVTAAVARIAGGVVLPRALVVVARVAIGEAVAEHEIDDLIAPIGRRRVAPGGRRRSYRRQCPGQGESQQERGSHGVRAKQDSVV